MWIPNTVYEVLPAAYVGVGVLFIIGASYLGLADPTSPLYVALGIASILTGAVVYLMRRKARRKGSAGPDDPPTL